MSSFFDRPILNSPYEYPNRHWELDKDGLPAADVHLLPELRTDVFLSAPGNTVVIEAKCVNKALVSKQDGALKLRSAHLYQLLAYLSNTNTRAGESLTGVLLYAGLGARKPLDYVLSGRLILIRNVNLDQPWEGIHADLLTLAGELAAA